MGSIADKLNYLNETKQEIKQAIINKGVNVSDTDTFRSFADKIEAIEGGVVSGTQLSKEILQGEWQEYYYGRVNKETGAETELTSGSTILVFEEDKFLTYSRGNFGTNTDGYAQRTSASITSYYIEEDKIKVNVGLGDYRYYDYVVEDGVAIIELKSDYGSDYATYDITKYKRILPQMKNMLGENTITKNGTYIPSNYNSYGFSCVKVEVPSQEPNLIEKSITENGTYLASDDGADGYSAVSVNIENKTTASGGEVPEQGKSMIVVYATNTLGLLVPNAGVTISDGATTYNGTTDNNGKFVQQLEAGTYTVTMSDLADNLTPAQQSVEAQVNETNYVYMVYTATTIIVNAKKEDGSAVSGATVTITSANNTYSGTTNESGVFTKAVVVGEYTVSIGEIDGEYHTPESQTVSTTLGQETIITMTYNRIKTALKVYALDNKGIAVVGAEVTITGTATYNGTTNDDGLFYKELGAGTYTISVNDQSGFNTPESQTVTIVYGQELEIDMVYVITLSRVFGENTWATINSISNTISSENLTAEEVAATYGWNLGDKKSETLSTGEVIELQIVGFNHDDKSDGSGKAGLTLQMVDCLATQYTMGSGTSNSGGYVEYPMKTTTLPTIKAFLSQSLQDVIKLVDKKSSKGSNSTQVATSSEDIFLLSLIEVDGSGSFAISGSQEGTQYEFWNGKAVSDRVKKRDTDADGVVDTNNRWWLRSCQSKNWVVITADGSTSTTSAWQSAGVSFALCI